MLLVGLVESEKLQYRSCVYKIMPLIPVMQTAKQKRDFFDPNRLNVRTEILLSTSPAALTGGIMVRTGTDSGFAGGGMQMGRTGTGSCATAKGDSNEQ